MDVDSISLSEKALHVGLLGYNQDEVGNQYCCSFPLDKAIDPFRDVIVAYEINGEPIPRSHRFPVKAIIPGKKISPYSLSYYLLKDMLEPEIASFLKK